MKKKLVHEINAVARFLPEVYETHKVVTTISGDEANLCVVGRSPHDPKKKYQFENTVFVRVNHVERIKDGIRRYGEGFITSYLNATMG